jgi:outer membrane protein
MLFNGKLYCGCTDSKAFPGSYRISRDRTELEIISQVIQAYYLVLVSEQSRTILEANLGNMRDLLDKTRALVAAGVADELDYDQLSVQATMIENGLKAAERQVELSYNMLRLQMGLDAQH